MTSYVTARPPVVKRGSSRHRCPVGTPRLRATDTSVSGVLCGLIAAWPGRLETWDSLVARYQRRAVFKTSFASRRRKSDVITAILQEFLA